MIDLSGVAALDATQVDGALGRLVNAEVGTRPFHRKAVDNKGGDSAFGSGFDLHKRGLGHDVDVADVDGIKWEDEAAGHKWATACHAMLDRKDVHIEIEQPEETGIWQFAESKGIIRSFQVRSFATNLYQRLSSPINIEILLKLAPLSKKRQAGGGVSVLVSQEKGVDAVDAVLPEIFEGSG